jgi:hypothetical protein
LLWTTQSVDGLKLHPPSHLLYVIKRKFTAPLHPRMQGTRKTCKPCSTEKNRKRREQQRKKNKAARPTFMDGQYQTRPYQLVRKCGHWEIGWANATTLLEARHGAKGHVMIISRHRGDAHVGGHSAQAYYYCGCAKHPSKESRASPAQRAAHDQERNLSGQAVSTKGTLLWICTARVERAAHHLSLFGWSRGKSNTCTTARS